jgi:RNA polymerase sigma-70 factor (ECF subfamily)
MTPPQTNTAAPDLSPDELDALVARAKKGNRGAFNLLIQRFQPDIHRMIFYRLRSRFDAEDLTQDVFISAFRGIGRLRETERFRGWLYRIALNRVRDHLRKKRFRSLFTAPAAHQETEPAAPGGPEEAEAVQQVLKADFWRQIGLLLKKLSRMEKEVFVLRFMDQLEIREIAAVLNKGESTVKTHLYRALSKFKQAEHLREFLREKTP